jgi:hypothetical protein
MGELQLDRCGDALLRSPIMPIRRMLEGGVFDQTVTALLSEVFDEIVSDLDLRNDADREKAAKIVIRLAQGQTDLDAAKIRAEVVRLMRKGGAGHRRRPF